MPLMKNYNVNFSEEELLEYEEEILKELPKKALENVSGGVSLKSTLLTGATLSLMVLGGVGLGPANVHADNPVKRAQSQGQKDNNDNNSRNNNANVNNDNNDNGNANNNANNNNDNDNQIDINNLGVDYGKFFDDFENNQVNRSTAGNYHGVDAVSTNDTYINNKISHNLATDGTNVFAFEPTSNPNEVKIIRAFAANNSETLVIPPTLTTQNGQKVTVVEICPTGEHHMPNIHKIVVSENEKLKNVMFDREIFNHGCERLESVEILQKSVDTFTIGSNAFSGCPKLETFVMPQEVKGKFCVTKNVFNGCSLLRDVCFPKNAKVFEIWDLAFANCSSLEEIVIPQDAQMCMIKNYAFYNCSNLRKVVMPPSAETVYILGNAFEECRNFKECIMPTNINKAIIQKDAFLNTGLNTLNINGDELSATDIGVPFIYKNVQHGASEKFDNIIKKNRKTNNNTTPPVKAAHSNFKTTSTKKPVSGSGLDVSSSGKSTTKKLTPKSSNASRDGSIEDNAGPKLRTMANRVESSSSSATENNNANVSPNEGQSIFIKIKNWGSAFISWLWRAITFWR